MKFSHIAVLKLNRIVRSGMDITGIEYDATVKEEDGQFRVLRVHLVDSDVPARTGTIDCFGRVTWKG